MASNLLRKLTLGTMFVASMMTSCTKDPDITPTKGEPVIKIEPPTTVTPPTTADTSTIKNPPVIEQPPVIVAPTSKTIYKYITFNDAAASLDMNKIPATLGITNGYNGYGFRMNNGGTTQVSLINMSSAEMKKTPGYIRLTFPKVADEKWDTASEADLNDRPGIVVTTKEIDQKTKNETITITRAFVVNKNSTISLVPLVAGSLSGINYEQFKDMFESNKTLNVTKAMLPAN